MMSISGCSVKTNHSSTLTNLTACRGAAVACIKFLFAPNMGHLLQKLYLFLLSVSDTCCYVSQIRTKNIWLLTA